MESMENKNHTTRLKSSNKIATMQRVCRTCMSSKELHPLFPKANNYQSFERALYLSTGLQIKLNDGMPQNICRNCAKIIESMMRFRSQSHSTEKKLKKYFKHKKKLETTKSKQKDNNYEVDIKVEDDPTEHEIKVEFELLSNNKMENDGECRMEFMKLEDRVHSPGSPVAIFNNKFNEKVPKSHTTRKKPFLDLLEPRKCKDPYTCKLCGRSVTTVEGFKKHSMQHLGYDVLCEFCGHEMATTMELLRHQRSKHGLARDNSFPCSYCEFKALDKEMKESHERRVHTKERPYVCDECGEAFFTKRVLTQHSYTHKSEKPFECNSCSKKFKMRTRLIWHMKTVHMHTNKYKYSCYLCHKVYNSSYFTRKHILKVHGVHKNQQRKLQCSRREYI